VGWYSGKNFLSENIDLKNFDYVKIGQYQEELGPLNNPNTNQKMFKINHQLDPIECENITYKFWK
jgi:anaerobic ribonucleoside-triphosphate reductase activating protein